MNINTRGVMLCFKYAAQQMIKQGGGGKIIGSSFGSKPSRPKLVMITDEGTTRV